MTLAFFGNLFKSLFVIYLASNMKQYYYKIWFG